MVQSGDFDQLQKHYKTWLCLRNFNSSPKMSLLRHKRTSDSIQSIILHNNTTDFNIIKCSTLLISTLYKGT